MGQFPPYPLVGDLLNLQRKRSANPCIETPSNNFGESYQGGTVTYNYIPIPKSFKTIQSADSLLESMHILEMLDDVRERLYAFYLNRANKCIGFNLVGAGDVAEAMGNPRSVFGPLLAIGAKGFIFLHNHPSGDPYPSKPDNILIERYLAIASIVKITMLDSLIVGQKDDGSFLVFSYYKDKFNWFEEKRNIDWKDYSLPSDFG